MGPRSQGGLAKLLGSVFIVCQSIIKSSPFTLEIKIIYFLSVDSCKAFLEQKPWGRKRTQMYRYLYYIYRDTLKHMELFTHIPSDGLRFIAYLL